VHYRFLKRHALYKFTFYLLTNDPDHNSDPAIFINDCLFTTVIPAESQLPRIKHD